MVENETQILPNKTALKRSCWPPCSTLHLRFNFLKFIFKLILFIARLSGITVIIIITLIFINHKT